MMIGEKDGKAFIEGDPEHFVSWDYIPKGPHSPSVHVKKKIKDLTQEEIEFLYELSSTSYIVHTKKIV